MSELLLGEVDDEGCAEARCRFRCPIAFGQLVDEGAVHLVAEERGI